MHKLAGGVYVNSPYSEHGTRTPMPHRFFYVVEHQGQLQYHTLVKNVKESEKIAINPKSELF